MMLRVTAPRLVITIFGVFTLFTSLSGQATKSQSLDERVEAYLKEKEGSWRDMNVPALDGKFMYDLILENNYTQALEIGTSTGHSGIWIAWALSKTGGKLTTIEIDEDRYQEALRNFKAAGLEPYIDARLANAHDLVKELQGPFDFVFSDADKDWYIQYFKDVAPKMVVGGSFIAHNIRMRSVQSYVDYVQKLPDFDTTIENERTSGISISVKTKE